MELRESRALHLVADEDDALFGQIDADVARRLAAGVEELHPVAGDCHLRHPVAGHERVGRDKAVRPGHFEAAAADVVVGAFGIGGQRHTIHVAGAQPHDRPGGAVLLLVLTHEIVGGDDLHLATRRVLAADEGGGAGGMIGVVVGVDDGNDRLFCEGEHQLASALRMLDPDAGIDEDDAAIAFQDDDVADAAVRRVDAPDIVGADLDRLFLEVACMIDEVLRRREGHEVFFRAGRRVGCDGNIRH